MNAFLNLTADPFRLSPDHRFCYKHAHYAKARAYMAYAFRRAEGFVLVTGAPGTGKTTLICNRLLLHAFVEQRHKITVTKQSRKNTWGRSSAVAIAEPMKTGARISALKWIRRTGARIKGAVRATRRPISGDDLVVSA